MADKEFVYIGTYTEPILFGTGEVLVGKGRGIYVYEIDVQSGEICLIGIKEGVVNPSYIAFGSGGEYVYAVNELKTFNGQASGTVSAFKLGGKASELEFLDLQLTMGTDPCHLAQDRSGKFVAVANYMSGSVAVFPIMMDGSLGKKVSFMQHDGKSIDPNRQSGPHAHSVVFDPSNRYLLVQDLGIDKIVVYDFDDRTGGLTYDREKSISLTPGSGPRYLEYHPSGKYAYLINELSSTVSVFSAKSGKAVLSEIQNIKTIPAEFHGPSTAADLHITPSGDYLYASNRGHDSLAIFRIDQDSGKLELIGFESTRGKTPRNFAIDPKGNFILVANQDSDSIVVFRINPDGTLKVTENQLEVPNPVCIRIRAADSNERLHG
jgi:6-phosphogluconolactonase